MKVYIENQQEADWFNETMEKASQPHKGMVLEITCGHDVLVTFPGKPNGPIMVREGIQIQTVGLFKMANGEIVSADEKRTY